MRSNISISDALETLQLNIPVTKEALKKQYRRLASKYHPDRNKSGLKIMQMVNVAYQFLDNFSENQINSAPIYSKKETYYKPKEKPKENKKPPEEEYAFFRNYGLSVNAKDHKIWVGGNTYHYRDKLKEHRFRWSPEEKKWWKYI